MDTLSYHIHPKGINSLLYGLSPNQEATLAWISQDGCRSLWKPEGSCWSETLVTAYSNEDKYFSYSYSATFLELCLPVEGRCHEWKCCKSPFLSPTHNTCVFSFKQLSSIYKISFINNKMPITLIQPSKRVLYHIQGKEPLFSFHIAGAQVHAVSWFLKSIYGTVNY